MGNMATPRTLPAAASGGESGRIRSMPPRRNQAALPPIAGTSPSDSSPAASSTTSASEVASISCTPTAIDIENLPRGVGVGRIAQKQHGADHIGNPPGAVDRGVPGHGGVAGNDPAIVLDQANA